MSCYDISFGNGLRSHCAGNIGTRHSCDEYYGAAHNRTDTGPIHAAIDAAAGTSLSGAFPGTERGDPV